MRMIWHIMKKDLRAVWPLWLAWLGFIALRILLLLYYLHVAGEKSLRMMPSVGALATIGDIVIVLGLVCRLAHEDPLVGDKAFWVTRPVKGSQLLAAKAFSAVLVCVVSPLALLLPTWLGFGVDAGNIGQALLYHSVLNGSLVVAGLLVAAMTSSGGAFFLTVIVSGVLVGLIATGADSGLDVRLFRLRDAYWTAIYLGLAAVLAAIAVAYFRRTTRFAWGVLASAVLLAGCLLPSSSGKLGSFSQSRNVEFPQVLDVKWREGSLRLAPSPAFHVAGVIDVTCANETDQFQLQYRRGNWTDAGGRIFPAVDEGMTKYSLAYPERVVRKPGKSVFSFPVRLSAPPANWADPMAFSGVVWIQLQKDVEAGSVLLAPGKTVRLGNLAARLVGVDPYEKGVRISVVEIAAPEFLNRRLELVAPTEESPKWQMLDSSSRGAMLLWLEVRFRRDTYGVQGVRGYVREMVGARTDADLAAKGWRVRWWQMLSAGATMRELKADQLVIQK